MLHGAEQFPWIEQIPGKDGMLQSRAVPGKDRMMQSRAVPGQSRFLEKTGCCRAEQFLDSLDFWKRLDAADQRSSGIEWIPGKDGMLQIRAVPGQNGFLEKTGCCRSEQFLDRIDSWKRQDCYRAEKVLEQSRVICGRERKTLLLSTCFFLEAKPFVLFAKM